MNPDTPKNEEFFIFYIYTSKKLKNHDFWRGTIFPILSSPRPDFHQNFAFSHAPAGKIGHKSDNIPFLDIVREIGDLAPRGLPLVSNPRGVAQSHLSPRSRGKLSFAPCGRFCPIQLKAEQSLASALQWFF